MHAARIHRFGSPDVIVVEDIPRPSPTAGEVLVRVVAAGVAPWDAIIREGKSKVSPPPPLTLGSDLSGVVEAVGLGVTQFSSGDEVYGVTNPQFVGAHAEYAVAAADMLAPKPQRLSHLQAASVPVVAVTAWQMLFEHARLERGQSVMVLGAAGNVGAYAVQFAAHAGARGTAAVQGRCRSSRISDSASCPGRFRSCNIIVIGRRRSSRTRRHRYVVHDHDCIYSEDVDRTLAAMGLNVVNTPVHASFGARRS